MAISAVSLYSESTVQSADSIESHPCLPGLFALGTYQVDQEKGEGKGDRDGVGHSDNEEKKGDDDDDDDDNDRAAEEEAIPSSSTSPEYSRRGTLRLKRVSRGKSEQSVECDTLCQIDTAAILDMKWLAPTSSLLSVALADSHVSLYSYRSHTQEEGAAGVQTSPLERIRHIQINDSKALCLSLDWSDRIGGYEGGYDDDEKGEDRSASGRLDAKAIISQSDGTLALLSDVNLTEREEGKEAKQTIETWKAHDYEAWTAAFDCWSQGQVAWSGGDDLTLKGWDLRTPCIDGLRDATFTVTKGFEGGVTSMQSSHLRQHLWAVGSYDGGLRLFDARQPRRPLSTTPAGGGIWRVKWHPTKPGRLLLGCMHDGFKVMEQQLEGGDGSSSGAFPTTPLTLHTRFDGHDSLAYGCDWDRGRSSSDLIYSCSFYDAVWHAWQCDE